VTPVAKSIAVAFVLLGQLFACKPRETASLVKSPDDTEIVPHAETLGAHPDWQLEGRLHRSGDPGAHSCLKIHGGVIAAITPAPCSGDGLLIRARGWIMPGLVDLHSHTQYNILPLWDKARGQFRNRFEWRNNFPAYKDAVRFNMTPITGQVNCAALRYAEIKALIGGTTTIQGAGAPLTCVEDFAVNNVEIAGELGRETSRAVSVLDTVDPFLIGAVVIPQILPRLENATWDSAVAAWRRDRGVDAWLAQFAGATRATRTLRAGLALALGIAESQVDIPETTEAISAQPTAQTVRRALASASVAVAVPESREATPAARLQLPQAIRGAPWNIPAARSVASVDALAAWIAEWLRLVSPDAEAELTRLGITQLGRDGILAFDGPTRMFVAGFEGRTRGESFALLQRDPESAYITHLAEGRGSDDPWNRSEFQWLERFGMLAPGMVMIHGVGLQETDVRAAAAARTAMVWSPFSNLLLYGETLDIPQLLKSGMTIAIGADWSPTGSKTVLGEMQMAKRYARFRNWDLSDAAIVDMATIAAGRALRRRGILGEIRVGAQADLLVVHSDDGETSDAALLTAGERDIELVIVRGQPLYGEPEHIRLAAQSFGDGSTPEDLPLRAADRERCDFTKSLRNVATGRAPRHATGFAGRGVDPLRLDTGARVEEEITRAMQEFAAGVHSGQLPGNAADLVSGIDPMFACSDAAYMARVDDFIPREITANALARRQSRANGGLTDDWSPLRR
jgi:cytosine/adenosine deaminase-related metal-dependent hydrolase